MVVDGKSGRLPAGRSTELLEEAAGTVPGVQDVRATARSEFVTDAFRAGADAHSIMRQPGHRDPKMLEVYAREFSPLAGNPFMKIDL